jgi:hypothetical protein
MKCVFGAAGLALWVASFAGATTLTIRFKAPGNAAVRIDKAEVLVVGWGWMENVVLPADAAGLVRLDFDSAASRSGLGDKFANATDFLLHIDPHNLAPVISERFQWPRPGARPVTVSFRNGPSATIASGEARGMTVPLNPKFQRRIDFVDTEGKPVPGLKVSASMFWSADNHCGRPVGSSLLREGVTDSRGSFNTPGGEFKYLLQISGPFFSFDRTTNEDVSDLGDFVITYLDKPVTQIQLFKAPLRSVRLRVYAGDQPLAGAVFSLSGMNLGLCGANWGEAAVSDQNGDAVINPLYVSQDEQSLCLATEQDILWKIDTRDLERERDPIEIRLPPDARQKQTVARSCD